MPRPAYKDVAPASSSAVHPYPDETMPTNPTMPPTDFEARRREQEERHKRHRERMEAHYRGTMRKAQLLTKCQADREGLVERLNSSSEPDDIPLRAQLEEIEKQQKDLQDDLTATGYRIRDAFPKFCERWLRLEEAWAKRNTEKEGCRQCFQQFCLVMSRTHELEFMILDRDEKEAKSKAKAAEEEGTQVDTDKKEDTEIQS